jgi:hypothetical protein
MSNFTPWTALSLANNSSTHVYQARWPATRNRLDLLEKINIFFPYRDSNPGPSSPLPNYYTHYDISAPPPECSFDKSNWHFETSGHCQLGIHCDGHFVASVGERTTFMKPSSFTDRTQCIAAIMHRTVGLKVALHCSGRCLRLLYGRTGPSFRKPKQEDGKHKQSRPWAAINCSLYCLGSVILLMFRRGRTQQFNNQVHFLTLNFKEF